MILTSREHWAMSGDIFGFIGGGRVLLASGGWRPGTLLNPLQSQDGPSTERDPAPQVNGAEAESS